MNSAISTNLRLGGTDGLDNGLPTPLEGLNNSSSESTNSYENTDEKNTMKLLEISQKLQIMVNFSVPKMEIMVKHLELHISGMHEKLRNTKRVAGCLTTS